MPLKSACSCIPQRWVVCALCSLALAIISYKNTCFTEVADIIDELAYKTPLPKTQGCPFLFSLESWRDRELPFELPEVYFNINIHMLNLEDSVFHLCKFLVMIPAGVLSDVGYSSRVLVGGVLLVSLSHIARPLFVDYGVTVKALENVAEGIGEGAILPAIISLISRWTPPWERNIFTAVIMGGIYLGEVSGHVILKLLYGGTDSWSIGHYFTGIVGLVWSGLCFVFVYHSPDQSPFVTSHEFRTITIARRKSSLLAILQKLHAIPWCQIVTSPSFISLVLVYCSLQWVSQINIDGNLRDYQSFILRLPQSFSDESSVTGIVTLPSILIGGFFADYINKRNYLPKIVVKRLFAFIGLVFSSVLTASACFVGCSVTWFWILSIAGCFVLGPAIPVILCAPVDLSPRHAGLLAAIMEGTVTTFSLFSGEIHNLLMTDEYSVSQWRIRAVFWAMLTVILMIPFLFFGSAEKQLWRSRRRGTSPVEHRPPTQLQTDDDTEPQPNNQKQNSSSAGLGWI